MQVLFVDSVDKFKPIRISAHTMNSP